MKITCISASNVEPYRQTSASTHACELVAELLLEGGSLGNLDVTILRLLDYDLVPCRMCGKCLSAGMCVRDEGFNSVYQAMVDSDGLFIVCPHYALIPAKLTILFEKLQEMYYLNYCQDAGYRSPLFQKPLGIIAHGGQTKEALPYYRSALLQPLAAIAASVQLKVIQGEEGQPGAVFGITGLSLQPGSIFVEIQHDWDEVRGLIAPLVNNFKDSLQLTANS
jgi:multimeric flavodoxin WrbA